MTQRSIAICVLVVIIIVIIIYISSSSGYCNCTGMATSFNRAPYTFWRGAEYPFPNEAINPYFNWTTSQQQQQQIPMSSSQPQWPVNPGMPFDRSGIQRFDQAYSPSINTQRDFIRDQQDGLIGVESTGEMLRNSMQRELSQAPGYKVANGGLCTAANAYIKSGILNSEVKDVWPSANQSKLVPLEAVGCKLPPGAVEYNQIRFGNGKFMEDAPVGTFRYGGYGADPNSLVESAYGYVNNYNDLGVGVL